jgi:hypothetical protein
MQFHVDVQTLVIVGDLDFRKVDARVELFRIRHQDRHINPVGKIAINRNVRVRARAGADNHRADQQAA